MYPFVGCYKNVSGLLVPSWTNPCNPAQQLAGCVKKQSGVKFPVLTAGIGDSCMGPLYGCDKVIDGTLCPVIEFASYASYDEMMWGCCTPCDFCVGQVPDLIRLLIQNFDSGQSGICNYQSYPSRWWKLVGYSDSMLNGTHSLSLGGQQAYYGTCHWWVCYTISPIQKQFYYSEYNCQNDINEDVAERQVATKLMIGFYLAVAPPPRMTINITLRDATNYTVAYLGGWTAFSDTVPIDCMQMNIVLPEPMDSWRSGIYYPGWDPEGVEAYVVHKGRIYFCLVGHTSSAISEPGVGANWQDSWRYYCPYPSTTYTITNGDLPSSFVWAVGNHYDPNDRVRHLEDLYRCYAAHEATLANEPGTGPNWGQYWVREGCR
ncbi:MAG TPA: hypothetical protein PKY88_12850 [Anaerohalosphaeraceae bacterium]|nr:hypothetical protein [Anaerohalosphaeraceae bacterium]